MSNERRLGRLTSLLRRRGIVLPSYEIYGGVSGLVDYGPVGARIKRKVIDVWVDHWTSIGNVVFTVTVADFCYSSVVVSGLTSKTEFSLRSQPGS